MLIKKKFGVSFSLIGLDGFFGKIEKKKKKKLRKKIFNLKNVARVFCSIIQRQMQTRMLQQERDGGLRFSPLVAFETV